MLRGKDLKKRNAIWLHPQKTLEHYLLRNGVSKIEVFNSNKISYL